MILELSDQDNVALEEISKILERHPDLKLIEMVVEPTLIFNHLIIDTGKRKVYYNQQEVLLTTKEYELTCYVDDAVAGNCEISFRNGIKTSHRATIAIAILKDCWGIGIGSSMFEELVAAAQNCGTEIMELQFIGGNERAKHLYEKFGFRVVSERPNAFKVKDGTYLSEIYMQKYL